ncbi:MAG TPA: RNA 2',3'-cyclic phosphodiesterase [Bacillus sp. (in: firmicutes)]|uniref:RNA 2',3'-cyclic phosphodiesterase n=1 Tax=Bacillus litorisediminis TaxID=2922713 RepID=UPI001FAD1E31|nr:RNA 2',3'-cyclic phosphodiesterase [Bacillus litorisediminis]HWO75738.1 RNA 2',3'-cyclic phosphodiesterase [Bacillus sp. (in: firmicutes)]
MSHHYFFAVPLPPQTKRVIKETCEKISEFLPFHKWVHEEDYHITLAFLGAAELTKVKEAIEDMTSPLQLMSPFSLQLDSFGTFGRLSHPRIFWVGVEKNELLHQTRSIVFNSCTKVGFELETRPFSPHITVARKWKGAENFHSHLLKEVELSDNFIVDRVVLYQTHLDRTPKYEAVETILLNQ